MSPNSAISPSQIMVNQKVSKTFSLMTKTIKNTVFSFSKNIDKKHSDSKNQSFELPEKTVQSMETSIKKACEHLFSLQKTPYWEARVYDNITITCEYIMTLAFLGLADSEVLEKAKKTLIDHQLFDGGWNLYQGGPSDHSATVEAYFALKICGEPEDSPSLKKALKKCLEGGGVENTRVFTKIHLALFGEYSWDDIPVIVPELMLMPRQSPIDIYEFSSWSRAVIIPLLIIFDQKPIKKLDISIDEISLSETNRNTVRKDAYEQLFELTQKLLSAYEKIPFKPFRKRALKLAEDWILEHQDPNGNWGGIYPAMANSIVALYLRGHKLQSETIQKSLKMLRSFCEETPSSIRMQSTVSPVWDTAISCYALQEADSKIFPEKLYASLQWLVSKQILEVEGDWKFKALPTRPGGWPFEHENDQYPDIDDTALAILALLPREKQDDERRIDHQQLTLSIDRGIEWILGMQGTDGGWGAFDRDNNREILNQIPFADLKSLLDPSTPDVTGHVLEALGRCGFSRSSKPIERSVNYLIKTQEKNGSWFGRWGVNYIYGTSAVVCGLQSIGEDMNLSYIQKSLYWLQKTQNPDGGWGESCASYDHGCYIPLGSSTASQTAWALMAMACSPNQFRKSIQSGLNYLLKNQNSEGDWTEPEYTGTGFPRHFYLRYDYYRIYFPIIALARLLQKPKENSNL